MRQDGSEPSRRWLPMQRAMLRSRSGHVVDDASARPPRSSVSSIQHHEPTQPDPTDGDTPGLLLHRHSAAQGSA
eukprot:3338362-Rhodomonas_salina.1